jgi:cation-transporting ATPase 13A1
VATLDLQEHKQFILFGGTTVLSSHPGQLPLEDVPAAPDDGAIGIVLRTGFETAQGSLLRTMAHTQKSVDGIHTRDTYFFILILLCCAIASAAAVWNHGWADDDRNKFRLILHVIIIVTSVVPPELPMELSLAVTNSVADLMKRKIFCTEVFRIPLAGQIDVCCFDKTGTLTSDEMQLKGVRLVDKKMNSASNNNGSLFSDVLAPDESIPWPTLRIMVGCHSLGLSGDTRSGYSVIGDPLEKTVLLRTGYQLVQNYALKRVKEETSLEKPDSLLVLHRYAFSSRLKRMSVLVRETSEKKIWVLSKGAPETLKLFLRPDSIPHDYDEISSYHMALGQRVLAMGYRELSSAEAVRNPKDLDREDVESKLIFAGFLLLQCPIKPDSKAVVSELWGSGHRVVMITGDALLTAAEVARQVGIIRKYGETLPDTYQLEAISPSKAPTCMDDVLSQFHFNPMVKSAEERTSKLSLVPQHLEKIRHLVEKKEIALCVSGDVLQQLVLKIVELELRMGDSEIILNDEKQALFHPAAQNVLKDFVPLVSVFARHAPRQKEAIVAAYNLSNLKTLMCGDGTNDVGALRRAHVGISIISSPEVEAKQRLASGTISRLKKERRKAKSSKNGSKAYVTNSDALALENSIRQLQEAQDDLDQVELGDASIASPFTSRMVSIKCCKDVVQQGRCTLVTMLQIYKILGVNCLVNAMILSKLFLHGAKQGDRQLTILGLMVAALFFFVTRGKPLPVLSDIRPPTSVLSASALMSIVAQFAVHYCAMVVATEVALSFVDPFDPSMIPDGPFNPNALNTCTFLVSATATVNTFAVNYAGKPFVEPLSKNTMLFRSLQLSYGVLAICALEVFPPLNDLLQLDALPDSSQFGDMEWMAARTSGVWIFGLISVVQGSGLPVFLTGLMVADTVLVFVAEKVIRSIFQKQYTRASTGEGKGH